MVNDHHATDRQKGCSYEDHHRNINIWFCPSHHKSTIQLWRVSQVMDFHVAKSFKARCKVSQVGANW